MTDGQIKAMFTMLEYIAKMHVESIGDLRRQVRGLQDVRNRAHNRQLLALRDEVRELRRVIRDTSKLIVEYLPEDVRHERAAVIKDFAIHKGGHRDE
jgi:hypothetical protein